MHLHKYFNLRFGNFGSILARVHIYMLLTNNMSITSIQQSVEKGLVRAQKLVIA